MRQASTTKVILLLSLPLIFLLIFYFYPLTKITLLSFSGDTTGQTGIGTLLSSPVYGRILWFTTWQAALSTFLTLLVALPGAYVFSQYSFPGKNLLMSLSTVPFVLPTVVTAAAFRALLGSNGIVNSWFGPLLHLDHPLVSIDQTVAFFLLAHVFYNYAMVLRIVSGYWSGISPELKSAAQMLGASPSKVFFKITLPLLLPAIASSALLVFIFCFTSFGVVLILGGPACATIEVEIYRQAVQLFNLPMAATLSLIQIGINFLFMWLHAVITRKAQVSFISGSSIQPGFRAQGFMEKCMLFGNLGFMLSLLVAPLLALLISSLAGPDGFTFSYYSTLFHGDTRSLFYVPPAEAIRNSIGFAVLTMLLALFFGSFAAIGLSSSRNRWTTLWDATLMLPLATSAVTLGFGYIITLNKAPLNLRDSIALVPLAHTLVAFPFVLRCLLPTLRRLPANLGEAATLLGASPAQVLRRITLPLISNAFLAAAIFAFSVSMGEFGATAFVARPHLPTMPVAIFRFLGQPGELNFGQAMAMSTILMLITCCGFWVLSKFEEAEHVGIKTFPKPRRT